MRDACVAARARADEIDAVIFGGASVLASRLAAIPIAILFHGEDR